MAHATALGDDHHLPGAIHVGEPARRRRIPAQGHRRRELARRLPATRRPGRPLGHGVDEEIPLSSIRHFVTPPLQVLQSERRAALVGPHRQRLHPHPSPSHHQEPPGSKGAHVEPSKQGIVSHTTSMHVHHDVSVCRQTDAAMTPGRPLARSRAPDRRPTEAPLGQKGPDRRAPARNTSSAPLPARDDDSALRATNLTARSLDRTASEREAGQRPQASNRSLVGPRSVFTSARCMRRGAPRVAIVAAQHGALKASAYPGGRPSPLMAASRDRAVVLAGSFHKGRAAARRREQ